MNLWIIYFNKTVKFNMEPQQEYKLEYLKTLFKSLDFTWLEEILIIVNRIEKPWFFVGGCVRDSLLGLKTKDIDITTLATPEEIKSYFPNFNLCLIGQRFGTIGIFYKGFEIQITTTRADITTYGRSADVKFLTSFEEDSFRRDFTINGLMFRNNILVDYNGGISDLLNQTLRFIKDPEKRIQEDYLRIIRYIRFFARFSKNEISGYREIIEKNLEGLKKVNIERIIMEIFSMAKNPNTELAIEMMNSFGISKFVFSKNLEVLKIKNLDLDLDLDPDRKMAFIFSKFPWSEIKKLPLQKKHRKLISIIQDGVFEKIESDENIIIKIANLWNKYHNLEDVRIFFKLQEDYFSIIQTKFPNNFPLKNFLNKLENNMSEFQKISTGLIDQFLPKERSYISFLIKYLYLKNIFNNSNNPIIITKEDILRTLEKFPKKIS